MAKNQNSNNQNEVNSSIVVKGATPFTTAVGSGALPSSTGVSNTAVGYQAGNLITSGTQSVLIGDLAGSTIVSASNLVAVGHSALAGVAGGSNTAVGSTALTVLATGTANTAVGSAAGTSLATGSNCTLLGTNAGTAYTGAESNNICIGFNALGTAAESNTTRIGNGSTTTVVITGINAVTQTGRLVTLSGSRLGQCAGIQTAPVASSTATTAFGTSLTAGTAVQNTTGYDILVNISASVTSATTAAFVLGVGSTSTPTTNTVTGSFTSASALPPINFTAIVPNNYYVLVDTSGTIVVASILTQVCPL